MKKYSALNEIRLNQVQPAGWLRDMLEKQRDGFPGHLDEIGYPFDLPCWQLKHLADGGFEQWWPYEQTGYWIDAMTRAALLLGDKEQIAKFKAIIDTSIDNAGNGFIGPDELQGMGLCSAWPHAVYFRAVYALWSATGDEKYLRALERHFMLEGNQYTVDRDAVNVEMMLRVAEKTGNVALLAKAKDNYDRLQADITDKEDFGVERMLSEVPTFLHGVTLNEIGKLPAIIYTYFGDEKQLQAVTHLYEKILRDHMLADGVHSSTEKTCGNDSLKCHESCDISDFTWSVGYLLEATGDAKYADLIERAILNAAPGAIGPDFKTMQYFSCVNQVRCARNSCHVEAFQNTPRMAYQPHHYPECCVGNIGRAFPNYIARMYWEDQDGIVCALYGDSSFSGNPLSITQSGGYPMHDTIRFDISCDAVVETTLKFRIPAWCSDAKIEFNGVEQELDIKKGFAVLKAVFHDGDKVMLHLPMTVKAHLSPEGGVHFDYGPLLLALKIEEDWQIDSQEPRQKADFPAYNVEPVSEWRYAVTGKELPELVSRTECANPWWDDIPMTFQVNAYRQPEWEFVRKASQGMHGDEGLDAKQIQLGATEITEALVQTPSLSANVHTGNEEVVMLVPYGCTNLRLSVFPVVE